MGDNLVFVLRGFVISAIMAQNAPPVGQLKEKDKFASRQGAPGRADCRRRGLARPPRRLPRLPHATAPPARERAALLPQPACALPYPRAAAFSAMASVERWIFASMRAFSSPSAGVGW